MTTQAKRRMFVEPENEKMEDETVAEDGKKVPFVKRSPKKDYVTKLSVEWNERGEVTILNNEKRIVQMDAIDLQELILQLKYCYRAVLRCRIDDE